MNENSQKIIEKIQKLEIPDNNYLTCEEDLEYLLVQCCRELDWKCIKGDAFQNKGIPDRFIITENDQIAYIEVKNPNGKGVLSKYQKAYINWLTYKGRYVRVLDSTENIKKYLSEIAQLEADEIFVVWKTLIRPGRNSDEMFYRVFDSYLRRDQKLVYLNKLLHREDFPKTKCIVDDLTTWNTVYVNDEIHITIPKFDEFYTEDIVVWSNDLYEEIASFPICSRNLNTYSYIINYLLDYYKQYPYNDKKFNLDIVVPHFDCFMEQKEYLKRIKYQTTRKSK